MKAPRSTLAVSSPGTVPAEPLARWNVQARPSQRSVPAAGRQSDTHTAMAQRLPSAAAATIQGEAGPDGVDTAQAHRVAATARPINATAARQTPKR